MSGFSFAAAGAAAAAAAASSSSSSSSSPSATAATAAPAGAVPGEMMVSFTTRFAQHRVPTAALALPTRLARFGLSEVVNHLLGRGADDSSDPVVPFEFLHEGAIVLGSVRALVLSKALSTEQVLELEYQPAMGAPEPGPDGFEAPDWVSCVDGGVRDCVLVGSYDGVARLLPRGDYTRELCSTAGAARGHTAPIKAVCLVRQSGSGGDHDLLAITASQDSTVVVWDAARHGGGGGAATATTTQLTARAVGTAHAGEVSCVAVDPERRFFCTGSWDKTACLWHLTSSSPAGGGGGGGGHDDDDGDDDDDNDDRAGSVGTAKRRRTGADGRGTTTTATAVDELTPVAVFEGHKGAVTGVAWASTRSVFTGSYDHNVVSWDVEAGQQLNVIYGSKVVTALDYNPRNALVATAHADNAVRAWDPRVGSAAVGPTATFKSSHTSWVSSVRWGAHSEHRLVSGSHDGTVKVWDVRACAAALHTIKGAHGGDGSGAKVLCVDWSQPGEILSGGTDNKCASSLVGIGEEPQ